MNALVKAVAVELSSAPGWLLALGDWTLKATVILGACALATRLLRSASASTRHLVWTAGVLAVAVLPAFGAVLPEWKVPVLPASLAVAPEEAAASMANPPAAAAPALPRLEAIDAAPAAAASALPRLEAIDTAPVAAASALPRSVTLHTAPALAGEPRRTTPARESAQAPSPSRSRAPRAASKVAPSGHTEARERSRVALPVVAPAVRAEVAPTPSQTRSGWTWLALLWGAGVAFGLAKLLVGQLGVRMLAKRSRPVRDERRLALVDEVSSRLGVSRRLGVLETDDPSAPMTWGVITPKLLLPAESRSWPRVRLERVLLHELAHVRRLDALTQTLAQLACAFYWFHPLVWTAAKKMRELREYACDDQVLNSGGRPSEYASEILELVRAMGRRESHVSATLAMARRSQLEGRLVAILDPALRRDGFGRGRASVLGLAALGLMLPLAALQPQAAAQQAPEKGPLPRLSKQEAQRRAGALPPEAAAPAFETPPAAPVPAAPYASETPPAAPVPAAPYASEAPPAAPVPAAPYASEAPPAAPVPPAPYASGAPPAAPVPPAPPARVAAPPVVPAPPALADDPTPQVLSCLGRKRSTTVNVNRGKDGNDREGTFDLSQRGERCRVELHASGAFSATDGGRDVASASRGARLEISRRGEGKDLELVLEDQGGKLVRRYQVDGKAQAEDRDAAALLSYALAKLGDVRGNAVSVRVNDDDRDEDRDDDGDDDRDGERAEREWHRTREYRETLDSVKAAEAQAREKLAAIDRENLSDDDRAERLEELADDERFAAESTRQEFLRQVERVRDPSDRSKLLRKLMQEAPLTPETAKAVLRSAQQISDDDELAEVLEYFFEIRESDLVRGPNANDYLDAVARLRDDEARSDALTRLLHPRARGDRRSPCARSRWRSRCATTTAARRCSARSPTTSRSLPRSSAPTRTSPPASATRTCGATWASGSPRPGARATAASPASRSGSGSRSTCPSTRSGSRATPRGPSATSPARRKSSSATSSSSTCSRRRRRPATRPRRSG